MSGISGSNYASSGGRAKAGTPSVMLQSYLASKPTLTERLIMGGGAGFPSSDNGTKFKEPPVGGCSSKEKSERTQKEIKS